MEDNLWFLVSWFKPASWYARQRGERGRRGYISRNGDFTEERKDAERWQEREEAEGMRDAFATSNEGEEFELQELKDSCNPNYEEALARLAAERQVLASAHQELVDFLPKKDHIFYGRVLADKRESIALSRARVRDRIQSVNVQLGFRQRDGFALELKPEVLTADEADDSVRISSEGVGWEGAENDYHWS